MRKQSSTNYQNEQELLTECPFSYTLSLIEGRWRPVILWKVKHGFCRFSQLKQEIPQITDKMLAQELRELEDVSLLQKNVFSERPLRVEYSLTELGRSLEPLLENLWAWGEEHRPKSIPQPQHTSTPQLATAIDSTLPASKRQRSLHAE